MRPRGRAAVLAAVALEIAVCGLTACRQSAFETDMAVAVEPTAMAMPDTLFQSGDLAFRCGRGAASDLVLLCEDEPVYSHVGLLVYTTDGWRIVHAAPGETDTRGRYDRVVAEPPADFWQGQRCRSGGVYRLPLTEFQRETLNTEAIRLSAEGRPFDHRFDGHDTAAFYCTELICFLYGKIGIDPSQGRRTRDRLIPFTPPVILPGHLLSHPDLQTIWRFPEKDGDD